MDTQQAVTCSNVNLSGVDYLCHLILIHSLRSCRSMIPRSAMLWGCRGLTWQDQTGDMRCSKQTSSNHWLYMIDCKPTLPTLQTRNWQSQTNQQVIIKQKDIYGAIQFHNQQVTYVPVCMPQNLSICPFGPAAGKGDSHYHTIRVQSVIFTACGPWCKLAHIKFLLVTERLGRPCRSQPCWTMEEL